MRLVVSTADVIHSFWVPELNRKIDLIPGQRNAILLEADRPGRYRGQCAEFCGLQHAHMALVVFADPPAKFRAWLAAAQRARAGDVDERRPETSSSTRRAAAATRSAAPRPTGDRPRPDARGSRSTLAAGTLPNDPAHLADWIRDPQHVKPGNRCPASSAPGAELDALARLPREPALMAVDAPAPAAQAAPRSPRADLGRAAAA